MSTTAGTLTIDIEARVARLEEGMRNASRSVKKATDDISRSLSQAKSAFLSVTAVLGLGAFSRAILESGDRLNDLSQKLGISASKLSAYEYAAKLGGASSDGLNASLTKLAVSIEEASTNKGSKAAKTFAALGVSVFDASGKVKSLDRVFEELSLRISKAPDGSAKIAAIRELAGRTAAELIPTMNNLAEATAEAERLGLVVSDDFVKKAALFDDSMDRMREGLSKFGRAVASDVMPALNGLIDRLNVAMGAQDELSLQTLERDRAALMAHYVALRQSGMKSTWAEAQALEQRLHDLDTKIIAANKRMAALKDKTGTAVPINGPSEDEGKKSEEMKKLAEALKKQVDPVYELNTALALYDNLLNKNLISAGQWADATIQANDKFRKAIGATDQEALAESMRLQGEAEAQLFLDNTTRKFEALLTEREQINAEYAQRLIDLENYYVVTDMAEVEYQERKKALSEEFQKKLTEIQERGTNARSLMWRKAWNGDLTSVAGVMGEVSNLMQSSSKKQFEIGKKAAIAQAIVNTYQAAASGFATTPFFPLGLAMGALAIANGINTVNKIKAQQFGGGGGAIGTYSANPNTGVPTQSQPGLPPQQQDRQQSNSVQVIIQGNVLGNQEFVTGTLIPAIADAINNGDQVIIGSTSRQAREIVNA